MGFRARKVAFATVAMGISFGLCGCVAPVAYGVLALASAKDVQTMTGGGVVKVSFPGKDGKEEPPPGLSTVNRVAVWPGDRFEVMFAEHLSDSKRFEVMSPASVAVILSGQKISANRRQLTEKEELAAFARVCKETRMDLIFASDSLFLNTETNTNTFSFSRANQTYKAEVIGYSCSQNTAAWTEQIVVVVDIGGKASPPFEEISKVAAKALADRVLKAAEAGTQHAISSWVGLFL